ncbi:hypothetical protein [Streptomyces longispororuber]|uniref:hypothetical protein n=1 Tax=Streptomyces longispororuber TaxID=68230 RepID=UPI002108768B|nr:hypothetical protein [Streptomyces longispororuber]MCQ4213383.1 hypothetical protein [Streptomyces longispororuber]
MTMIVLTGISCTATTHTRFTPDALLARWPTDAWRTELVDGVLYFYGECDERVLPVAEPAYPGRRALITRAHDLEVHPGGDGPLRSVLDAHDDGTAGEHST